jgi:predicted metal-dependent hydrolase
LHGVPTRAIALLNQVQQEVDMAGRIVPRRMDFPFAQADVPPHGFADNAWASHALNALNLVFPTGERYFVRSVLRWLDAIEDPVLAARTRAFFAQEALHGREHERAFRVLEAQGFEIASWLAWYDRMARGVVEPRLPPALHLATTAALEHLTASLAEEALGRDHLRHAHPVMADLLRWHAAEEIEHRDVAFDVLQAVDPRIRLRVAGMAVALAALLFYWGSAMRHLARQDPAFTRRRARDDRRWLAAAGIGGARRRLFGYALGYLRRDFHPSSRPIDRLAADYLASVGRLEA